MPTTGSILIRSLMTCILLGLANLSATAAERLPWPDKQGPNFDSNVTAEDAHDLPVSWDEETSKNIALKIPIQGAGLSTPVIGQSRVWLTSATEDGREQFVYCIHEQTGEILHRKLIFRNEDPEPLGNKVNTYASPSCVLEPDAVYVHFGTYGTARLNPETADIVWQRRDIQCRHFRGPGSSPVISGDLIFLTFDGIDQQFVMALNKQTGETVWRTDRSTDYQDLDENGQPRANGDYRKAFSTPALATIGGRVQLISAGSKAAFAYDALTGKEIWTLPYDTMNAACRPIVFQNKVIINTGSGRAKLYCVRLDETTRGDVLKSHVLWERTKGNSELSAPILVDGRLYMIAGNGVTSCVDAMTGEELGKVRIKGTFVASPIAANGLIYFSNEEGVTTVVKANSELEEVASNKIDDGIRASFGVANGSIWIRAYHHLYKITAQ